jgi:hypothetical protein
MKFIAGSIVLARPTRTRNFCQIPWHLLSNSRLSAVPLISVPLPTSNPCAQELDGIGLFYRSDFVDVIRGSDEADEVINIKREAGIQPIHVEGVQVASSPCLLDMPNVGTGDPFITILSSISLYEADPEDPR